MTSHFHDLLRFRCGRDHHGHRGRGHRGHHQFRCGRDHHGHRGHHQFRYGRDHHDHHGHLPQKPMHSKTHPRKSCYHYPHQMPP